MPSSENYVRDYAQEYKTAKRRGEIGTGPDSGNAKRHKARRKMLKLGLVKKGQDVDHKKMISKGGGNGRANLRATTPGANRSFPRNKDGSAKSNN